MKTLYLIGGTMGVGKTSACRALQQLLPNSVFLDGDWCWNIHPFQVTEETKALVLDNICYLLNRFLRCSLVESVIFCWGDGFAKHLGRNSEPVGHIGLHGEIHQPGLPSGSAFEAAAEGCRRRIAGAGHFGTGASASEPVWGVGHGQAGRIGKHPAGGGNANRSTANRAAP